MDGNPTYIMVLKDASGLVKLYAAVNVEQYNLVTTASTQAECISKYKALIGIDSEDADSSDADLSDSAGSGDSTVSSTNSEDAVDNSTDKELVATDSATITIADIKFADIDGNTYIYLITDANEIYKAKISSHEDMLLLIDMSAGEDEEEETAEEVAEELQQFEAVFEQLRISTLLIGPYDRDNAIVTLHAGAGGTEACDWCQMLFRMYTRWAESHGYTTETLDYLEGEEAGIKSVTIEIRGENAYGHLKSEHGVHRLVRISPFNAAGKRQTSFVSCDVMPDINQDIDIEINDDDLRIDTYRSSGAGGQHINKTSSAIRITHLPTGIVVQCQNERSQHQNKDKAMQMLKAKLYLLKEAENAENLSGIRGDVKDINFGSQIRSYVLQPYTMVKDNRTNKEVANAGSVLDGNIDPFINAYLTWISTGKTEE